MSDPPECNFLCERCSLLSFDDAAIGGYEVVGEDGVARLRFPDSKIEIRPEHWLESQSTDKFDPSFRLVRLDWKLDDILPDMPHLFRSSQLGCSFCQALRRSLEETFAKKAESYHIKAGAMNLVAYLALVDEGVGGLLVEATCNHASFSRPLDFQFVFPIEADSNCGQWLGTHPVRDASYLDPSSIRKMRQMLDYCTSKCHPVTLSSFMPTRLIDVGDDACANSRLVLSSTISRSQQPKYAALSYCWGNEKDAKSQFTTEKSSLRQRCVNLPSELLTSTTNDAIAIARSLGLRYLWIDALCIIQDDEDDWVHESSQMDSIYRHAFVTFCSLTSDSCHESFLNRAPAVEVPFQSKIRRTTRGSYLIRLRPRMQYCMDLNESDFDFSLSKWSKRCWTYQEQEMSGRLLLFGNLNVHFSCGRCRWSEGDDAPRDTYKLGVMDQVAGFKDNHMTSTELYESWDDVIDGYGCRLVTLDKDRLPAIAGLARMIGETLQDRYLAGLWKGDLHHGLMWYSQGDTLSHGIEAHIRNMRERNYIAPSWSWAACPDVVGMGDHRSCTIEESTIVDVDTDTRSDDPYGQVSGGFLYIRGKMARIPKWLLDDKEMRLRNVWALSVGVEKYSIHVHMDWLDKGKEAGLENLLVLLLYRTNEENHDETEVPALRALLLHPADGLHHYYRVGMIRCAGYNAYKEMRSWFKDSQEDTICII